MDKKIITIIVITLLIGFLLGFQLGTYITLKSVASMSMGFLDVNLLKSALFQYKNNIGTCYPSLIENASIYNIQGN